MSDISISQSFDIVRSVGNLERLSTARHNLGYYRCVANTVKYRTNATNIQLLFSIIETAVAKVVLRHPALCCGIINEDKDDPAFIQLESIDLSSCIKYYKPDPELTEEDGIVRVLEYQHRQLWPNLDSQPGWKVIIIPTKRLPGEKSPAFDAVFAFHHALADGLSGLVFHRSMLEALNESSLCSELSNHILKVPRPIELAPAVEQAVNFQISWIFFFKAIWNEFRPRWLFPDSAPPFTGAICLLDPIERYESRVKVIAIPSNLVESILAACREQKATVTGFLHGLILTSLATHVPEAASFSSVTPYSLRHLTGLSLNEGMGTQLSALSLKHSPEVLSRIRSAHTPRELMGEIWDIARSFRKDMAAELAGLPNDNLIGMLPYVSSIHQMFQGRLGKPRSDTYEVSNIGTINNAVPGAKWRIDRTIFSQSGMGTGPSMSFNVASVAGGPLTISVTWLDGDSDSKLVELITKDLSYALRCIGEGKEITIGL
ncbi:uncharacterized protein PAC_05457 [Phialocephala subalpina]|uniref:Alcohol acetyltransferase FCK4 n=1 Tax=Phialocephala subalpina TaxID=576137 RepID=A0A1L7WS29_9HELO|nr:uncharacterized protein PAC_05457 [Phialocephala subalpina]